MNLQTGTMLFSAATNVYAGVHNWRLNSRYEKTLKQNIELSRVALELHGMNIKLQAQLRYVASIVDREGIELTEYDKIVIRHNSES